MVVTIGKNSYLRTDSLCIFYRVIFGLPALNSHFKEAEQCGISPKHGVLFETPVLHAIIDAVNDQIGDVIDGRFPVITQQAIFNDFASGIAGAGGHVLILVWFVDGFKEFAVSHDGSLLSFCVRRRELGDTGDIWDIRENRIVAHLYSHVNTFFLKFHKFSLHHTGFTV